MKVKKLLFLWLPVLGIVALIVFFRPSDVSKLVMLEKYEENKKAFTIIADYLTKKHISMEINAPITMEDGSVPLADAEEHRKFCLAVERLMAGPYQNIISDGNTVTFVYEDNGGLARRKDGFIIYNGLDHVEGKETVKLEDEGWHLYISR